MEITLLDTNNLAQELLIMSKNTRHLDDPNVWDQILKMSEAEKAKELEYVFGTITSAFEFVDYVFLLRDVTRAFTHQVVRHRVGTSFAQQSMRVAPAEAFKYFVPDDLERDQYQIAVYDSTMMSIQEGYNLLLNKGTDVQDARGVLPTNICTNILMKINLRALALLMETRLCIRAQGEFQQVALAMKEIVSEIHPWAAHLLFPMCVAKNHCQFINFKECPLKNKYPHLQPIKGDLKSKVENDWMKLMEHNYSPQPKQSII